MEAAKKDKDSKSAEGVRQAFCSMVVLGDGEADGGAGAFAVFAVDEADFAAVGAGNLLRERETDTAALWLGGVEGHEEVVAVGDAEAAVFNADGCE